MVKIGFIDYYLDEWHANNYPKFFDECSDGEYRVSCAFALIDSPDGMTNKQWSEKYNIPLANSIDELIESSDCIVVLSPDNPEMHYELSEKALKSGKRVYIDKTFAMSKSEAERIFALADEYSTPCWSTSSLGFATELKIPCKENIDRLYIEGPENVEIGAVHLAEQAACLIDDELLALMSIGDNSHPSFVLEYKSGKRAYFLHRNDNLYTYAFTAADRENNAVRYVIESDFFAEFIKALIEFFKSGEIPVSHKRTLCVVSIIEAELKAMKKPFEWIEIS